ncbi:MAG: hypothetical protein WD830_05625 [Chloroflexota bacterium]
MTEARAIRRRVLATIAVVALLTFGACAAQGATRTIPLETLNDSGVTGAVTLTDVGQGQTQVDVRVEPAGNLDMPAHIHPGTCVDLVPQPRYPLRNVVNGVSSTVVPASLSDLLGGDQAVNIHRSNDDLRTYTACADLR